MCKTKLALIFISVLLASSMVSCSLSDSSESGSYCSSQSNADKTTDDKKVSDKADIILSGGGGIADNLPPELAKGNNYTMTNNTYIRTQLDDTQEAYYDAAIGRDSFDDDDWSLIYDDLKSYITDKYSNVAAGEYTFSTTFFYGETREIARLQCPNGIKCIIDDNIWIDRDYDTNFIINNVSNRFSMTYPFETYTTTNIRIWQDSMYNYIDQLVEEIIRNGLENDDGSFNINFGWHYCYEDGGKEKIALNILI